ncbi:histidine phosphatase family protein [Beijerinckia sp. L45]|uniref:SixA phosphatase family protein n=1 Tax=Beijerinckia sp. L45 TaxID=1641855 RepID=UPI00131E9DE1|nr:histidine phosphatase family protein [Beijerinckia sp. L45]
MLTLLLLRHAKAVGQTGDDFARVLTDKGHAGAARLGTFLADKRLVPDRALVSPSARTRQTLADLQTTIGRAVPATEDATLYNATRQTLRDTLRGMDAAVKTLMIIGHNPGIAELALKLADSGDLQTFDAMRSSFPPCSLAVIVFDHGDWEDARSGGGRLERFVTPSMLGG